MKGKKRDMYTVIIPVGNSETDLSEADIVRFRKLSIKKGIPIRRLLAIVIKEATRKGGVKW